MKLLQQLYLTNRLFYALGGVVACFVMAFFLPAALPLAWVVFAAVIGLLAFDAFQLFQSAHPLSAQRETPQHFSLHDPNHVEIHLENLGDRPLSLSIIDELPDQFQMRDLEFHASVQPHERTSLRYELTPLKRGEYWFGNINVFVRTRLGLAERRVVFQRESLVKVYPSFVQMKTYELMVFSADRMQVGIKRIRKLGHGYEFSDIRKYVVGDDPRAINWKASSRTNKLMVNNYQDERSQQIYALINKSRVMRMPFGGLSLLDYAINATLSLQNIVLRNQDHAGLVVFSGETDTFIRAERRFDQRQRLLDALYNVREDQLEANYEALYESVRKNIRGRSMLMLFTNFMSLNALLRVLPILKQLNRSHLLTLIFFENTELEAFIDEEPESLLGIASNVLAAKLSNELTQVVYELRNAGIQVIQSTPEDLTANSINKYLELKSRGLI